MGTDKGMDTNTDVKGHFDRMVDVFDQIYEGKQRSLLYRTVDALFRKNILERRLKSVLMLSGDVSGKDVLDIGCGPGRYAVSFAKAGSSAVLGIDVSRRMVESARRSAESNNAAGVCRFEECDFINKRFDKKFDIVIASGLFDYMRDPGPVLMKIKEILKEKALITFPVKWTLFTPVRMLWLKKRKCPSYYYSRGEILRLLKDCGLKADSMKKVGSFVVPGNYVAACSRL